MKSNHKNFVHLVGLYTCYDSLFKARAYRGAYFCGFTFHVSGDSYFAVGRMSILRIFTSCLLVLLLSREP